MALSDRKEEKENPRKLRSQIKFNPNDQESANGIAHALRVMPFNQLKEREIELKNFTPDNSDVDNNCSKFRIHLEEMIRLIIVKNLVTDNQLHRMARANGHTYAASEDERLAREAQEQAPQYIHKMTTDVSDDATTRDKEFVAHFQLKNHGDIPGRFSMVFKIHDNRRLVVKDGPIFSNSLILKVFETDAVLDDSNKNLLIKLAELEENNRKIYENLKINDANTNTAQRAQTAFDDIRTNIGDWINNPSANRQRIEQAIEEQTIIRPILIEAQFNAEIAMKPAEIENKLISDFDRALPAELEKVMDQIFSEAKNIADENPDFEQLHLLSQILESTRDMTDRINRFSNKDEPFHKDMLKIKMENYQKLQEKISNYPNGKSIASFMLKVVAFIWSCTGIGYFAGRKQLLSKSRSIYHEGRLAARMTEMHAKTNEASKRDIRTKRSR